MLETLLRTLPLDHEQERIYRLVIMQGMQGAEAARLCGMNRQKADRVLDTIEKRVSLYQAGSHSYGLESLFWRQCHQKFWTQFDTATRVPLRPVLVRQWVEWEHGHSRLVSDDGIEDRR